MTKSEFIRKQPFTVPAAEVVEAGKRKGLKFSPGLVNVVRSAERKKLRSQGKPVTGGRRSKAGPATAPQEPELEVKVRRRKRNGHNDDQALEVNGFTVRTSEERELCELSLQIGFTRAAEVLNGFRVKCIRGLGKP